MRVVLHRGESAGFHRRLRYERRKETAADHGYLERHAFYDDETTVTEKLRLRAQVLARARARRSEGKRFDTVDTLVTEALRRELAARRINPDSPPAYPSEARMRGRWPGVPNSYYRHAITARVPTSYAYAVTGAAWAISGDTVLKLREQFPRGKPNRPGPERAKYDKLSAGIVTAGDIHRRAVRRVSTLPRAVRDQERARDLELLATFEEEARFGTSRGRRASAAMRAAKLRKMILAAAHDG